MATILAFYQVTNQLIEILKQDKMDRDVRIEQIQTLLDQREDLLKSIQLPFSQQDKELGKQLLELNQEVEQLLQKQKWEITEDIHQLQIQKESNQKYTNPYESLAIDGIFYDKRK